MLAVLRSRIRMTTRSPYWVGRVETRRSMFLPSTRRAMRPSRGRRRSAMSISPKILMRETVAASRLRGTVLMVCNCPSTR